MSTNSNLSDFFNEYEINMASKNQYTMHNKEIDKKMDVPPNNKVLIMSFLLNIP